MKRNVRYSEINKEPRAPGRYTHDLECNSHSSQLQVNHEYEPRVSTPKDFGTRPTLSIGSSAGEMASPRSEITSPRNQEDVDDIFISGASTLCSLFKEQEFISHQINLSLTELCVQLKADRSSHVNEATPERPKWQDGDRGLGRGRGRVTSVTGS